MFLKKIILRGFKTFADQTEIDFGLESRITAVVGPNGCGKSNLLDAIRWVLGEDNSRRLRVSSLSDIIFAGTAKRKTLSMGEVSLIFDNTDGKVAIPYSELGIKRRTFREGESEFSINKNTCRLKDIKDLLLDTGLGEGSYAIITQGEVDAILSSKGEERRAVFEEAAGINKYKTRKVSAEKKLIAAEQNILRISDLKIEVEEHIITLEDQARKAKEYLAIQKNVRELELGMTKKIMGNLIEKKIVLEEQLAVAKQATAAKEAEEKKGEEELLKLKAEVRKIESELDSLFGELDRTKDKLRDLELNRRFFEGEIERDRRALAALKNKKIELLEKIDSLHKAEKESLKIDASNLQVAENIHAIAAHAKELARLLASIISFFNQAETFQVLDQLSGETSSRNIKIELLEEEAGRLAAEISQGEVLINTRTEELKKLSMAVGEDAAKAIILEKISKLKFDKETINKKAFEFEESIHSSEKLDRAANEKITALEIAIAKIEGEMVGLHEKIFGEYNLSMKELEELPYIIASVSKARTEIDEGKLRLRELEPVNLLAIEEFEKSKDRLSFLGAQLEDLNSARENLKNLIIELDKRAEEVFLETMQQLSAIFSETFSKLFTGGEAKIFLTPNMPALEAEIEIEVRPSGRKWLPLSMLSGGERSLCAIAILFSLLKIRPSPFCLLDEVDAALDEANIGRFVTMLKDLAVQTQIIIISHNKRTMEVADNIHGVTMQEAGVSRVISVKLANLSA